MRVKHEITAIGRHYFDSDIDPAFDDNHNVAILSLYGLAISWILAFFTIGIPNSLIGFSIPLALFMLGWAIFGLGAVSHLILFIFGSFYKYGVFKSIGVGILGILGLIALVISGGFILYGGIFVGAFIFLFALPIDTVLVPFNFLGFLATACIWYMRGLRILEGDNPQRVFSFEIQKYNTLKTKLTNLTKKESHF